MLGVDDHFELVVDAEEDELTDFLSWRYETGHQELARKNKTAFNLFLGKGKRAYEVGIMPRYYGELLTWALKRHMEREGWQVAKALGYHRREPVYLDVSTACGQKENLLINGQLLLERGDTRLIVTLDVNPRRPNSIVVEGLAESKDEVTSFVAAVLDTGRQQNFYRGKDLEYTGRIQFLEVEGRSWDSVVLDESIKKEIRANTVGFLAREELSREYGIPRKRGLLLAGEPGTGKTIICRALMAEAKDVTCIIANAYVLDSDAYLTELYDLAADLSPSIVFIEDIDLIGQNREEYGYQKGYVLVSLLSLLDGIQQRKNVVTIATTNCLETLDKALSQRPSRFDRVIRLTKPRLRDRLDIISRLCQRIPLSEPLQQYVADKTDGFTPAQVQEIVYGLVIDQGDDAPVPNVFSRQEIDRLISRVSGRNGHGVGFHVCGNHHAKKVAPHACDLDPQADPGCDGDRHH